MTLKFEPPSTDQYWRFLASFLFGGSTEPGLRECVWRGYLDLNRTLRGFAALPDSKDIRSSGHSLVERLLAELINSPGVGTLAQYDEWHRAKCEEICRFYAQKSFPSFCVGQAQKWLNMSVKYALVLDAIGVLPSQQGSSLRGFAHIPIDAYIVAYLRGHGAPDLGSTWSRIQDYEKYFRYQKWFRDQVEGCTPLDAEFRIWIAENRSRKKEPSVSDRGLGA